MWLTGYTGREEKGYIYREDRISKAKKFRKEDLRSIEKLLEAAHLVDIQKNWQKIIGEKLYPFTYPARFYKGKLTLYVEHPSIQQILEVQRDEIARKIFRELGISVKKIRFVVKEIPVVKENDSASSSKEVASRKEVDSLWEKFLRKIKKL